PGGLGRSAWLPLPEPGGPGGVGHADPGRTRHLVRSATLDGSALRVPASARRLEGAAQGDADRQARDRDGPRPLTPDALDVAQQRVGVGVAQVAARALHLLGAAVGDPRRAVLALLAQLLGDAPDVAGGAEGPLAGLGGAL